MKSKLQRRVMFKEGKPMAVLRPGNPLRSLNAAKRAVNTQDYSEVTDVAESEERTFVGWLALGGDTLLDEHGNDCGQLQPGDHMVTFNSPEDMQVAIDNAAAVTSTGPSRDGCVGCGYDPCQCDQQ
jgi:hypothetical protein